MLLVFYSLVSICILQLEKNLKSPSLGSFSEPTLASQARMEADSKMGELSESLPAEGKGKRTLSGTRSGGSLKERAAGWPRGRGGAGRGGGGAYPGRGYLPSRIGGAGAQES